MKLSEKEEMDLFDIQEALPSGFSGEETLNEIRGLIDKRNEISGSLASLRDTPSLEKRRTELEDFFSGRVPSGDQIAYMEERLNAAENLRARSSRLFSDASSRDGSRSDNSLNGKWIALILLGLLCAAAGCALLSLSQQFSMGVVFVVCGVVCVVLALVFGKGNTRASVLPKDVINDASRIQATKLVAEAAGIDEEVRAFVDMYFGDGRPSRAAIDTLRRNLDELRQIEETINGNYSDSRNLEDQLHRCEIDLREALGGSGLMTLAFSLLSSDCKHPIPSCWIWKRGKGSTTRIKGV